MPSGPGCCGTHGLASSLVQAHQRALTPRQASTGLYRGTRVSCFHSRSLLLSRSRALVALALSLRRASERARATATSSGRHRARAAARRARRQADPFALLRRDAATYAGVDLVVFEENHPLKTVGNCPFNSGWLACFDVPAGESIATWRGIHDRPTPTVRAHADAPVRCSGSTLGTRSGLEAYVDAMLAAFDRSA